MASGRECGSLPGDGKEMEKQAFEGDCRAQKQQEGILLMASISGQHGFPEHIRTLLTCLHTHKDVSKGEKKEAILF